MFRERQGNTTHNRKTKQHMPEAANYKEKFTLAQEQRVKVPCACQYTCIQEYIFAAKVLKDAVPNIVETKCAARQRMMACNNTGMCKV